MVMVMVMMMDNNDDDDDGGGDDDDDGGGGGGGNGGGGGGGGGKGFVNHLAPLLASPLDLALPLLPGPGGTPPPCTILLALSG